MCPKLRYITTNHSQNARNTIHNNPRKCPCLENGTKCHVTIITKLNLILIAVTLCKMITQPPLFISAIGKYTVLDDNTQHPTNESLLDEMLAYLTNAKSVLKSFALESPCHSGNRSKLSTTLQKVMLFYLFCSVSICIVSSQKSHCIVRSVHSRFITL